MTVTREQMIKMLASRTGFYQRDVRKVLSELDDLIEEQLSQVNDENQEVLVQVIRGAKFKSKLVPERERRNPRTNQYIVCKPTIKLMCQFSETLNEKVNQNYKDNDLEENA